MRILLDTQLYLWYLADDPRLTPRVRDTIGEAKEVYVSVASIWECAIKIGLGKLHAEIDELVMGIEGSGFAELPISAVHASRVAQLPHHHRDPFDRLLVAQAIEEPLTLLTTDARLRAYAPEIIRVVQT